MCRSAEQGGVLAHPIIGGSESERGQDFTQKQGAGKLIEDLRPAGLVEQLRPIEDVAVVFAVVEAGALVAGGRPQPR
jgi:hypothetical protein